MTGQGSIFDLIRASLEDAETLDARFSAFHAAHPEVERGLRSLARQAVGRGHKKLGIGQLFEVLRWQTMLGAAPGEEPYRLNNSYRSRYARLLMDENPELAGVFETRRLSDE